VHHPWPIAAGVLVAAACTWTVVHGTRIQEISFEETSRTAEIVVVGRVVETPEFGTYDPKWGVVVRRHRFHVDEYLKGEGPAEIMIATLGGKYKRSHEGTLQDAYEVSAGQPQLPEGREDVLLFLTRHGDLEAFMICSASHGVVPVKYAQEKGENRVVLAFGEPAVMPEAALAQYRRLQETGSATGELVSVEVPLRDVKHLIERAAAPRPKSGRSEEQR
jgi:hypothetical protein